MRYLVTGCAGFIASKVSAFLLRDGHEVVGVDNLNDAYDPRLKEWRLAELRRREGFEFHQVDISSRQDLSPIFRSGAFDAVFNLAARAGVRQSLEDPWVYVDTNTTGTLNILEACRVHDIDRMVLASTSSLYGKHNARPFAEEANTDKPLSPYAASKKGAESMAAAACHLYGIHTPVLRYFTVYGPAGRPDMSVFRFIRWIAEGEPITVYGDGAQERDFTFVDDIARGTIAALVVSGHEIINLGGDTPYPLNEVIALVEQKVGRRAIIQHKPFHKADIMATWANISKARKFLEWAPQVGLEEGIGRTVDWYVANRAWAKNLELGPT